MSDDKGSGIKLALEKADADMSIVNKEMNENYVRFLTLKNYQDKLSSLFKIRVNET